MACGITLSVKRSLEYDPVHSPVHPSPKRRCVPLTMSPSAPPTKCYELSPSPFAAATPKITAGKFQWLRVLFRSSLFSIVKIIIAAIVIQFIINTFSLKII